MSDFDLTHAPGPEGLLGSAAACGMTNRPDRILRQSQLEADVNCIACLDILATTSGPLAWRGLCNDLARHEGVSSLPFVDADLDIIDGSLSSLCKWLTERYEMRPRW